MTAPRRKAATSRDGGDWGRLILSAGLAAAITSAAGVWNDLLAARQQRCLLSQQIVGDETLNPALSLLHRQTLALQADQRLRQCLGGKK